VNLEIGNIIEGHWSTKGERLSTFINKYLIPSNKNIEHETATLSSQHPLLDQNPELKNFFQVPEYSLVVGTVSSTIVFIETKNSITPVHFNSYDNFFVQVAGFTYIKLYAPSETKFLYSQLLVPGKSESDVFKLVTVKQTTNMTMLNVEKPDLKKYPLLAEAKYTHTVLSPGDILFIPRKYWYYRRNLTTSISITFCSS